MNCSAASLVVAVDDSYAEGRLGGFGRFLNKRFGGLSGVVTTPEPSHFLGKLCASFCRCMGALAEGKMEVVTFELERIGHADISHGPRAIHRVLLIVASVLDPDSQVAMILFEDLGGIIIAALRLFRRLMPLNGGKGPDPRDDTAEAILP